MVGPLKQHGRLKSTKELRVLIFGWFLFPFGSAGASRVRHIAKGLIANNTEVEVLTIANIVGERGQKEVSGDCRMFENIRFRTSYPIADDQGQVQHGRFWRAARLLASIVNGWRIVSGEIHARTVDVVYLYGRNFCVFLPVLIICRIRSIPVVFEINEWPPASNFPLKWLDLFYWNDFLGRQLPKLGGASVVAITTFIRDRYARSKVPVLVMPSIADFDPVSIVKTDKNEDESKFKVVYAGSCKKNDGFGDLLDAIESIVEKGISIQLEVIGNDGAGGAAKYKSRCARSTALRNCVFFNGFVSELEYSEKLRNAFCLILPRPNNVSVKAAFPTRLPEFLATGNPVITSNVPDVPKYLTNGIDIFLYDPEVPNSLEDVIYYVICNPSLRLKIGNNGRLTGANQFSYLSQTNALASFLKNLKT